MACSLNTLLQTIWSLCSCIDFYFTCLFSGGKTQADIRQGGGPKRWKRNYFASQVSRVSVALVNDQGDGCLQGFHTYETALHLIRHKT